MVNSPTLIVEEKTMVRDDLSFPVPQITSYAYLFQNFLLYDSLGNIETTTNNQKGDKVLFSLFFILTVDKKTVDRIWKL
jgi:hypothetical protein